MHKSKVLNVVILMILYSLNLLSQVVTKETDNKLSKENEYIDGVIQRVAIKEQRVLSCEDIREADVVWEKKIWRVLDTREKMNQKFVEFESPFIKILLDAALREDIKVFEEDKFKKYLSKDEIYKIKYKIDTVEVYDPDKLTSIITTVITELDLTTIKTFRLKEIWYFDKETSRLECKILGIAPIKIEFDKETGLEKYEAPLFWVYYPEAKKILSKERVFNDHNDATPLTWSDVFDGRAFSSYIYKENNVQGYRLIDQFERDENLGLKVLLEADKIRNRLLDFEHDLWVY